MKMLTQADITKAHALASEMVIQTVTVPVQVLVARDGSREIGWTPVHTNERLGEILRDAVARQMESPAECEQRKFDEGLKAESRANWDSGAGRERSYEE